MYARMYTTSTSYSCDIIPTPSSYHDHHYYYYQYFTSSHPPVVTDTTVRLVFDLVP